MANWYSRSWYGSARSNYVRVKDRAAFRHWALSLPDVEIAERDGAFALLAMGADGGWPSFRDCEDEQNLDEEPIDLAAEIAAHLAPGEVCILQEVGADRIRHLSGSAWAV